VVASTEKREMMHIREKDLENHFEGDKKESIDEKKAKPAPYKTDEVIKSDSQVLRALDLLKGWEILKTMGKIPS